MKRVYSAAGVDAVEGGYCVTLDTRPAPPRTPAPESKGWLGAILILVVWVGVIMALVVFSWWPW